MQQSNQAWISMFLRIPAELHDTVVLGLRTGVEIVLQKFIKLEPDFMIIRGRVSGTQDGARVTLVPYGELSFVTVQRALSDIEVETIFGKAELPTIADAPAPPVVSMGAPPPGAAPAKPSPPEPSVAATQISAPDVSGVRKPEQMSKVTLLAKLRERLKNTN